MSVTGRLPEISCKSDTKDNTSFNILIELRWKYELVNRKYLRDTTFNF